MMYKQHMLGIRMQEAAVISVKLEDTAAWKGEG